MKSKKKNRMSKFLDFCAVFTITVLFIVFFEVLSYFIRYASISKIRHNNIYRNFDISGKDISMALDDEMKTDFEYTPYVNYWTRDYNGSYVKVEDHKRRTINLCESNNSIEIWFFGGSAAFGSGVSDEYTIPSLLSKKLCELNHSVKVVNFGERGYVSTQEALRLILELRQNKTPDIVVFYDGFNDIYASYVNKMAGTTQDESARRIEFKTSNKNNLFDIMRKSNLAQIINWIIQKKSGAGISDNEKENLISDTVSAYKDNFELVKTISESRNIKYFFFFQPAVYSKKNPTAMEMQYLRESGNFMVDDGNYRRISDEADDIIDSPFFYNLAGIFDGINTTIFVDEVHKSIKGNDIEAEFIADKISYDVIRIEKFMGWSK